MIKQTLCQTLTYIVNKSNKTTYQTCGSKKF